MMRKIIFLLFPKVHLMDFAGPLQVFYEANKLGRLSFDIRFAATTKNVKTQQSIHFSNLHYFENLRLQQGDFVCIPGIDFKSCTKGEMKEVIGETKNWLKQQRKKGVYIGSVCSGSLILGKMGLLNGIRCTTHWKCSAYFQKKFPKALLQPNRLYCLDQGTFTSAGMTAGIDMALALVEKWKTPLLAAKVAQEMVINIRRPETKEQKNVFLDFKNHFNEEVYKAQEIIANRLDTSFTIKQLAREMALSPRHLSRLFKSHTGKTIQAYRDHLRIEHGEKLLLNSEKSIKEIAIACGFQTARQFIRLWKSKKNGTPTEYRLMKNKKSTLVS